MHRVALGLVMAAISILLAGCPETGNPCTKDCPKEAGPDQKKSDVAVVGSEAGLDATKKDGVIAKTDGVAAKDAAKKDGLTAKDATKKDVKLAKDAGGTPCGPKVCNTGLQICMVKYPVAQSTVFSCEPLPAGCEDPSQRTCACAGSTLCTAPHTSCTTGPSSNHITCVMP